MFYETSKNDHGLPRCPFKAIVSPRPVGWVTSMSAKGEINLAPYSFFNAVSDDPPIVMFSSDGYKDSLTFVAETKEFVCNLATFDLRSAVVATSASFERGINEMIEAGLDPAPSRLVRPPRVAASPAALECKRKMILELGKAREIILGEVVGLFVREDAVDRETLHIDQHKMDAIGRLGGHSYARTRDQFEIRTLSVDEWNRQQDIRLAPATGAA